MLFLHTGLHDGMTAQQILVHLLEPDHIAVAVVAMGVAIAISRARRRLALRAIRVRKDGRP